MALKDGFDEAGKTRDDIAFRRLLRWLLAVGLALAVGGLIWMVTGVLDRVHNTLTVIVFAILFGYLVYPPVKWLANRNIPVMLAGIIVYITLGVVVLGSIAWLAPAIAVQASDLAQNFPHVVADVQHLIADPAHAPFLAKFPLGARTMIA